MSTAVQIVVSVTRGWVRLYTSRVPRELRVQRRAEVDADLWDHHEDALQRGETPLVTALQMLLRTCLGVPDDLGWCVEARHSRWRRRFTMALTARQTRWMGILTVAGGAVVLLLFGIVPTLTAYFRSVGIPLPLPTRVVMGMSALTIEYWWAVAAGLVVLFFAIRHLHKLVFSRGAEASEAGADVAAEALLTRIEPIMIVGLGVVVGALVLSMFLPIFDVVNATK